MKPRRTVSVAVTLAGLLAANAVAGAEQNPAFARIDALLSVPCDAAPAPTRAVLELVRQDFEPLATSRSCVGTPLAIGQRHFARGLGTHANSHIRVYSPDPVVRLVAWAGVDANVLARGGPGSVIFSVSADGRERFRSNVLHGGEEPVRVDLELPAVDVVDLFANDAGDGPGYDHADWAEAAIITRGGKTMHLDELSREPVPALEHAFPFSFVYDGTSSDELLRNLPDQGGIERLDANRLRKTSQWTDVRTGLRVTWETVRYADFPASDWLLSFENTGDRDTPILEDIQAIDITLTEPRKGGAPYRLHRTNGAPSNPTDFEPTVVDLAPGVTQTLGGGGGRSSNKDFPFFKFEHGSGAAIVAVGWSGQWAATLECPNPGRLRLKAGMERTHFVLHPGERVRMPRILYFDWEGDPWEANAQFRQLIYKHYAADKYGKRPLPALYCNTCFTRGGGWLNECNAENQISLIRAYAPLGLEALLTDAGWFEGGWPHGAGNWTPRADAYPGGMGPVAAAAKEEGMIYGLWFEPERVMAGTWIHQNHPEWLLAAGDGPQSTYLLNLGLPEARDYFFDIVRGFMELPGFRVYRQDFNMDPLPFWRHAEPLDRQGIAEIRYIEGLYAFWDRIAATWPDSLRIECASGGRRIDLETILRMHIHQKSDYWFDNVVDQASIWGLAQYLPNNLFMTPINRMDDYSFHSALAASLCMGWIADATDFDVARGKRLLERYRAVRHLLIGAWYPLLPYSRDAGSWIASQYHRPDLDEGMVLVFRRDASSYASVQLALRGLDPQATYVVASDRTGTTETHTGAELARRLDVTLPERPQSDLIVYRRR